MKHYIYMQGIAGCIPAYCTACQTREDAIEHFVEMNDPCIDQEYYIDPQELGLMDGRWRKLTRMAMERIGERVAGEGILYAYHITLVPVEEFRASKLSLADYLCEGVGQASLGGVLANEIFEIGECDCDTPWIHDDCPDVFSIGEWLNLLNEGARYEVVERCNGFYVYDNETGDCKGMGDGVEDVITLPDCPYIFSLEKNYQWMAAAWTYAFNRDEEVQEAYFG